MEESTQTGQALKPGAMLRLGTYRIEKVLGQGGFGLTYLATDEALDKKVAVKEFFPKQYCGRQDDTGNVSVGTSGMVDFVGKLKSKFLKEARNIAKFNHPNIIKIHAAFEENNTAYYVMDYIEGESLSDMVKRRGPLPETEAVDYICHIGNALEYIHAQRINHLDVKPANIMIRQSDATPILIDFGLSKQYDTAGNQTSTTPTGISHGYAPMEQYNDGGIKEFSPQTDIYSLAATLYYLLTGIVPPQASKLIEEGLTFPENFPKHLIEPINRAMTPIRRNRHKNAALFLDHIKMQQQAEAAGIKSEDARPKPEPQPELKAEIEVEVEAEPETIITAKPKRRDKAALFIAIAAVAVIITGIVVLSINHSSTNGTIEPNPIGEDTVVTPKIVESMYYSSALGDCSYSGEVDENNLPHGHGVATWASGTAKQYDGEWVHGHMDGQTTYTQRSGDTFVGTFKNDKYLEGTYTDIKTGDHYIGTFNDGNPATGAWYDKNGNKY